MIQAEYENQCEMLSVMDRPIKMKTITLTSDIVDGKQRTHTDWGSMDFKKRLFESIMSGNDEIPQTVIWQ